MNNLKNLIGAALGALALLTLNSGAAAGPPLDVTGWTLVDHEDDWSYTNPDPTTGFMEETSTSSSVEPGWAVSDIQLCETAVVSFSFGVDAGAGDDDLIGFAFAYEDNANFYLLDWKRNTQGYNWGDDVVINDDTAEQGIKIKRISGGWTLDGLWGGQDGLGVTTVAGPVGGGWVHGTLYNFEVELSPGHILIRRDDEVLFDVKDEQFAGGSGAIAFYGFSQSDIRFTGVIVDSESSIPEDLSGDCVVDVIDLLILLGAWNSDGADLNDDGTTDVIDLLILLGAWS